MYEYFVQDKRILQSLGNLGIASKAVSTILPTAQTLKYFDILYVSHLRDTSEISAI